MSDPIPCRPRDRRRSPLATGIVLIVIGTMLLAFNLGWTLPVALRSYWPLLLIVPGVVGLVAPSRHLTRNGGLWLIASGLYCQISISDWIGLGWFTAWPIFVIAYGLDIMIGRQADFPSDERNNQSSGDQVSHE